MKTLSKKDFLNNSFLIYGAGKSGLSTLKFLNKDKVDLFDDNKLSLKNFRKKAISKKKILKKEYDYIILSPGIDKKKCSLKSFLKKNEKKIITDLDIFYLFNKKNISITITGTNGKSTVSKLIFDIIKKEKKDVRLVGNFGLPILSESKISLKTIFVIEASSYQLEYSKFFRSKFNLILNISTDHLERHGNLNNYINAKLKIFKNTSSKDYGFIDDDKKILKRISKFKNNFICKIIKKKSFHNRISKVSNPYFKTQGSHQNLAFIFKLFNYFKVKKGNILKVINNFRGLKFRQQIIFKKNNLVIINDSKATSFSSSEDIIKQYKNIFWVVGGIPKKGDRFLLNKNYYKFLNAYIYGNNLNFFKNQFRKKISYQTFHNLDRATKKALIDIKKNKYTKNKTLLFSPSAASFDMFKNFEVRGEKFNNIIKRSRKNLI